MYAMCVLVCPSKKKSEKNAILKRFLFHITNLSDLKSAMQTYARIAHIHAPRTHIHVTLARVYARHYTCCCLTLN